ncbi:MAG: lytic transglycosylase domain-containing protein [Pseudomonadota bacterium]
MRARVMLMAVLCCAAWPGWAAVSGDAKRTMALCWDAAIAAADRNGVPRNIMLAITLVETRTKRDGETGPWPWTVNVAGKGAWLDSRAQALLHAQRALAQGQTSFDVGCFQLNYRWHGQHFASIDQMFEPGPSGDYAARFVKSLHEETGDWIRASGLYHSRTPKHAARYRGLVKRVVARMDGTEPQPRDLPPPQVFAATPVEEPRVLRVAGTTVEWPLQSLARVRTPTSTPQSAGAIGLGALRRARGGLLTAGPRPRDG